MDSDSAEPDLTPMLDVVFIMLIFFIVTATFVKEVGLDLPSDQNRNEQTSSNESVVIDITSNNRFKIQGKFVDKRALRNRLSAYHAESPERPLVIRPHGQSETEYLVYAMDTGRLVGMSVALADGA